MAFPSRREVDLAPTLRAAIEDAIGAATGAPFRIEQVEEVAGGCIHRALELDGGDRRFFLKLNDAPHGPGFEAEADGLAALAAAGMRVPQPIAARVAAGHAFLVLEFLDLGGGGDAQFRELGARLARLHGTTGPHFGWRRDNFIGATPQKNASGATWLEFWRERRLRPQLDLARKNGHGGAVQALGTSVVDALPDLLADHAPAPSLVHGDLWSGNAGFLENGAPVVFDPAVYYGDAEVDLAMTELFGGFPPSFYEGYREVREIGDGYRTRRILYNLYHVLNHLNLFGGGYLRQAEQTMERLIAAARQSGEKR